MYHTSYVQNISTVQSPIYRLYDVQPYYSGTCNCSTLSREPAFVVTTRATKTAVAPRLIEAQAVVAAILVAVAALLEILYTLRFGQGRRRENVGDRL